MMKSKINLVICVCFLLLFLTGCKSEEKTEETSSTPSLMSQFLAEAPVLKMDIPKSVIVTQASKSIASRTPSSVGSPSVGGCMAWSVRKNAINAAAVMQELSCSFNYMAANHSDYFKDSNSNYFNFTNFQDNNDMRVKIDLENKTAKIQVCLPNVSGTVPSTSNAEITATQVSEKEYQVKATWISEYPFDPTMDTKPIRYFEQTLDASGDGIERFTYFDYWQNDVSPDACTGASGTGDGTDDTCFLALSGTFINDTNALNPTSIMVGNFAEKNNAGARTAAAVYAYFSGGQGQSQYSAALPDVTSDVNADTTTDTWSSADFTKMSAGGSEVSEKPLPSRRTERPAISNPWDCQADSSFVEVPVEYVAPVIAACRVKQMAFADITSCTDPTEIGEAIGIMVGDQNDPLKPQMPAPQ